jgi:hypothetical protein
MNLPFYKPKGYLTSTPIPLFLTGVSHHHARAQDGCRPRRTGSAALTPMQLTSVIVAQIILQIELIPAGRGEPQVPVRVDLTALFNYCAVIFLP